METSAENLPLIQSDAVVFGMLMVILTFVFRTSHSSNPRWQRFYGIVPSLLLCYFLPSLLSTAGIISGENSDLYFVASRYLLPTSLVLLTISIDLPAVMRLGPKALIMFLTGTTGIVIPYSCSSWIHSIHRGIDVARAAGIGHLAAATGSTSEAAVQKLYGLPEPSLIDMGDFVGDDAGELVFVPGGLDQAGVHTDITAGEGERIDVRVVDDEERELVVAVVCLRGQTVPDVIDVLGDLRIFDDDAAGTDVAHDRPADL